MRMVYRIEYMLERLGIRSGYRRAYGFSWLSALVCALLKGPGNDGGTPLNSSDLTFGRSHLSDGAPIPR